MEYSMLMTATVKRRPEPVRGTLFLRFSLVGGA